MRISAAIKDYLVEIEVRQYTPRTIESYRNKLNAFNTFLVDEMDIHTMDEITPPAIRRYTQYMIKRGNKGTTVNGNLKTIKSFIQYCYEEEYGGFDTKRVGFKWVKEEKPIIKPFSSKDVRKMLESAKGMDYFSVRDTAVLTMLFETGIRCFELFNIKPGDIKDDYIVINGKNHKQRVVPITPILKKSLMRYERARESYFSFKAVDNYYFLSTTGKQLTHSTVERIVKKHGESVEGVRVSPHTCRHFFAQQQIRMGTDLYTISRLLGHENISITQIYLNSLKDEDIIKMTKSNSVLMSM